MTSWPETSVRLCVATSRPIGERCKKLAGDWYRLYPMEECNVFISVMYDTIVKPEFIEKRPCYNFHPGVLPWYRGAGAYSWAIINGEFESGVTLHEIDRDIDHGDVIDIRRFPITEKDTAGTLFAKAEQTIYAMFQDWLHRLVQGDYRAMSQESGRIYYRKDLERQKDLTRFVRAFTFEGKENAYYRDHTGKKIELIY